MGSRLTNDVSRLHAAITHNISVLIAAEIVQLESGGKSVPEMKTDSI